jgi:hypothetical protein
VSLINSDNLVVGTLVKGSGGDGIFLRTSTNQITNSQSTGNGGFGANIGCGGTISGFTAKNNTAGSLNTVGGTCTQINNNLQ